MDKRSSPKGTPRSATKAKGSSTPRVLTPRSTTTGKASSTARISKSGNSGRFVSAAPVRTKAGSDRLVATLKNLGADPKVVEAARGS